MTYTKPTYLDLVSYKRPEGSKHQTKFCNRFLVPVFGKPDAHGNFIKIIKNSNDTQPTVAFMAHHDTVHRTDGKQKATLDGDFFVVANENCLGADCTTGVYIILRMIEANVPGVYVIHAGEEIGCVGSRKLVKDSPDWLAWVKAAISLDRMGYDSVITHQLGNRTCSDEFANSLATILDGSFAPDPTGVYTDSNEYIDVVPECTNLSVGYFDQHTKNERQDNVFMECLIASMIDADWSKLVIKRKAGDMEYDCKPNKVVKRKDNKSDEYKYGWGDLDDYDDWGNDTGVSLQSIMERYPDEVAILLESYGYNAVGLLDDVEDIAVKNNRSYGRMDKR